MGLQEEIAIIGMACRVPGADSVEEFWRLVADGRSAITPVPRDRETLAGVAGAERGAGWGGFLTDPFSFDAGHFGISPAEAPHLDVQQRLVLETAWHALEDSGIPVLSLAGSQTGVWVGQATHDHAMLYERGGVEPSPFVNTGMSSALTANRLSYHWDLLGPSMTVDTACSSSLVAIHLAARALRSGECDHAVVAGVNALLSRWPQQGAASLTALSPSGRCRPFDAGADGYVRAEGVGVVVLRRVADLDGRTRIRAVIRGSATNQDGRTNGITAPSGRAQTRVIQAALADAATDPADIGYVETHGTGTPLGDPIEARALAAALTGCASPVLIGSAKGNVGHTEAAAGVVGLIRAVLVLEHRVVPLQAGHDVPSPRIDLTGLNLEVPTAARPIPAERRVVGVSSFGFGGSNAHVVLADLPRSVTSGRPQPARSARPVRPLLLVSGSSPGAVRELLRESASVLEDSSTDERAEIVSATATHRSHLAYRAAVSAVDLDGLPACAAAAASRQDIQRVSPGRQRIAFVFSGHGSQWTGMGRRLYREESEFARVIDECDVSFRPLTGGSLRNLLESHSEADLGEVARVQPLLFAIQVALARLLESVGVRPAAVVGHSVGEIAAAVVSGALTLSDGCAVIHHRNQAVDSVRGHGGMALLELGADEVPGWIDRHASIDLAAVNGPRSCVVSGPDDDLDVLLERTSAAGIDGRRVRVDYPSHSRLVEAAAAALTARLATALSAVPSVPSAVDRYSTVTGCRTPSATDARYWGRNLREPVQFHETVTTMCNDGVTHLVEISPHPLLLSALRDSTPDGAVVVPTLTRDPGGDGLGPVVASLYETGVNFDYAALHGQTAVTSRLPRYPFDHSARHRLGYARPQAAAEPADAGLLLPNELRTNHLRHGIELLSAGSVALLILRLAGHPSPNRGGRMVRVGWVQEVELIAPIPVTAAVSHDPIARLISDETGRTCVRYGPAGGAGSPRTDPIQPGSTPHPVSLSQTVDIARHVTAARAAGVDIGDAAQLIVDLVRSGDAADGQLEVDPEDPRLDALVVEAALIAALAAVTDTVCPPDEPALVPGVVTSLGALIVDRLPDEQHPGRYQVRVRGLRPEGVAQVEVLDGQGSRLLALNDIGLDWPTVAAGIETTSTPAATNARGPEEFLAILRDTLHAVIPGLTLTPSQIDNVPFAELGVDSLLAAEMRNRLERRTGRRLSMSMFWRHPTVKQLAITLAGDVDRDVDSLSRTHPARPGAGDAAAAARGSIAGEDPHDPSRGHLAQPLRELLAELDDEHEQPT